MNLKNLFFKRERKDITTYIKVDFEYPSKRFFAKGVEDVVDKLRLYSLSNPRQIKHGTNTKDFYLNLFASQFFYEKGFTSFNEKLKSDHENALNWAYENSKNLDDFKSKANCMTSNLLQYNLNNLADKKGEYLDERKKLLDKNFPLKGTMKELNYLDHLN